MSIADCSHEWIDKPEGGATCSRCGTETFPITSDRGMEILREHARVDGKSAADFEVERRRAHVCREDIEAEDARPRCATCGQFVAFRPLEHGPDAWQAKAIERIRRERLRQDAKWGEQNHAPERWSLILTEETGEVAKAALERDHKAYIAELVQVAAVALSALECAARGAGATEEA